MRQDDFDREIRRLERRLRLLRGAQKGESTLRRIKVRSYHVKGYMMPAHERLIERRR